MNKEWGTRQILGVQWESGRSCDAEQENKEGVSLKQSVGLVPWSLNPSPVASVTKHGNWVALLTVCSLRSRCWQSWLLLEALRKKIPDLSPSVWRLLAILGIPVSASIFTRPSHLSPCALLCVLQGHSHGI